MARQLRIEYPGALHHITNRGNERRAIFGDARDRETFLETLSIVIERFKWLCHGYVQMDNHYHLLIETPKGILSGKDKIKEIPRGERYSTRLELEELFQRGMISGKSRDDIIYDAYHDYDYTMREIGHYLELHYATISRAVKKCEEQRKG